MGPLSGITVIELAGIGPVPFCGMVLSDLGADVVRLDRPATGERDGMTALTDGILGRGRRSLAVDLKHPDGAALALDLIGGADACVEGFRPGVMERLGLGPEACLERNPRLVYGRLTGWGQEGPYAQAAGHDLDYLALAGALAAIGRRGQRPVPPVNLVADFGGGGLLMAMGLLAALLEAARSGRGQVVDAAMIDGSAYLMTMMYELFGRGAWVEERESNANDGAAPFYDVYETADGEHVAVAPMEPRFWAELLEQLGIAGEPLPRQWDPEGWPALKARLAEVFASRTRAEWCERLEGTDACFAPVLRMSEAIEHPHNVHRGTFVELDGVRVPAPAPRFDRTPAGPTAGAPEPGQQTDEVLRERGYDDARIERLRRAGAIR